LGLSLGEMRNKQQKEKGEIVVKDKGIIRGV